MRMLCEFIVVLLVSSCASLVCYRPTIVPTIWRTTFQRSIKNHYTVNKNYNKEVFLSSRGDFESAYQRDGSSERSEIPSRYDTCLVFSDGIIGMEPKDVYLKNGHHVVNFPIALIGHFSPVHEWERFKPTETMWISCEIWDTAAEKYKDMIRKGGRVKCVGHLLSNKWTDKNTGEERKQFRYRITKILDEREFLEIVNLLELDSISIGHSTFSDLSSGRADSNFSSQFPDDGNQINEFPYPQSKPKEDQQQQQQRIYQQSPTSQKSQQYNIDIPSLRNIASSASHIPAPTFNQYPTWGDLETAEVDTTDYWQ